MNKITPNTVLMTTDTVGGVWVYALDLCRILQNQGINVHLATMGAPLRNNQRQAVNELPGVEYHESTFALEWMNDPWTEVDQAGEWLMELEQNIQPDLVHLNSYAHGSLEWQAPVLVVGHSCVISWWEAVKNETAPKEWNEYQKRVREGLLSADEVVTVSKFMSEQLHKHYGLAGESSVIYNGRNEQQFYAQEKEPFAFSMGRVWDEAKNITALREIAESLPWPVFVAGDDRGVSKRQVENIRFLGQISQAQAADWLSKASIYALPALYEPFGLSVLEAALSECALIVGNIPSLREIWDDAALYVDPHNPADLKDEICQLAGDDSRRKEMAYKAHERAKRFTEERFGKEYLHLYKRLVLQKERRNSGTIHETQTSDSIL